MTFLIYTPKLTNRVRYIFEFIFEELLGISINFTTDIDEFISFHGRKINYSKHPISEELFIQSSSLLLENGIKNITIEMGYFQGIRVPFATKHDKSLFPFDPFAASFYLLSRYEEYLPFTEDNHGRFPARESLAYKNAFLKKPVINYWAIELEKIILARYTDLKLLKRKYKAIITYDIDIAYCYKYKGFLRNVGGFLRALYYSDWNDVRDRMNVLSGKIPDPYNTYQWQNDQCMYPDMEVIYFFLLSEYGKYDKNISYESSYYQRLIQDISDKYTIGIHPSYQSNFDLKTFKNEIALLSEITKRAINRSRQHYLKLRFPDTYSRLIDNGITKDYTMGYADEIGFRAGVASSFWFYNLNQENKTSLRIYPFYIMDVTLQYYMQLDPEEAIQYSQLIIDEVKKVNGLMTTLWHNHSLSEYKEWKNWLPVYQHILHAINN
jgi:hypothetical protein